MTEFRVALLGWYDRHRRRLPWRALEGVQADPYCVWLSEIMLQQTTVAAVIPYFEAFTRRWPSVFDLARADEGEVMQAWAGLGYYARARNLIACARVVVAEHDGIFPADVVGLKGLPGIGDYTAAAIGAIAYGLEANVVDGNVERVMARVHAVEEPLPNAKTALKELAFRYTEDQTDRTGDYAQALMDLGATICTPRKPLCALCPVNAFCKGYRQGIAETLPVRAPKKDKPQKFGHVFWIENERGEVLIEQRPKKGLLGGMLGLPTSEWSVDRAVCVPDYLAGYKLQKTPHKIRHSFTHFDLELSVYTGFTSKTKKSNNELWFLKKTIKNMRFATIFKKVISLSLS